ncbi:hypothetical protein BC831DRAFT_475295 [Entophlyctis helioformis]|nr:hypothetical protein BC831DRAFT_475295 [Entophlyctis helioformis]
MRSSFVPITDQKSVVSVTRTNGSRLDGCGHSLMLLRPPRLTSALNLPICDSDSSSMIAASTSNAGGSSTVTLPSASEGVLDMVSLAVFLRHGFLFAAPSLADGVLNPRYCLRVRCTGYQLEGRINRQVELTSNVVPCEYGAHFSGEVAKDVIHCVRAEAAVQEVW